MDRIFKRTGRRVEICLTALAVIVPLAQAHAAGTEKVLYSFPGGKGGASPSASLVADTSGNLYGTTAFGGTASCGYKAGCGTVFMISPKGKATVLHTFTGGSDGTQPIAGLIRDSSGNLYGTTLDGGGAAPCTHGCGTVFKIAANGAETVLYAFKDNGDGAFPAGGLLADSEGNLYGMTAGGGSGTACGTAGCGTVFKLATDGSEAILYSFKGGNDGSAPAGGLIADASGNFYGVTLAGGSADNCGEKPSGCGTAFKLATGGAETVLHAFTGGDGAYPTSGVSMDGAGNLYGLTAAGGSSDDCGKGKDGCGTLFKIATDGTETTLHVFSGGADGGYPAGMAADASGDMFVTTAGGGNADNCGYGAYGCGAVLEFAANGTETVLHAFTGTIGKGKDGAYPTATVTIDGRTLYGTTYARGAHSCGKKSIGCGTVFKLKE
jgi:uncharacterized repeat protein (TIGR03803 family)